MKKLGLICLALLIAVGSIGSAYAAWSQNLNLGKEVQTGTFIVGFDPASFSAGGSGAPATCFIASSPAPSATEFTVKIDKAYPGWTGTIDYTIKNTGTIPARVSSIILTGVNGTTVSGSGPWNLRFSGGTATDVIVANTGTDMGTTLEAGTGTAIGTLTVQVPAGLASSEAGLTGAFTFEILTQQNP
jgi:hypothetical protein